MIIERDLSHRTRVSGVERAKHRLAVQVRNLIDRASQRQSVRIDVHAAQPEAVTDEELDGVAVSAGPLELAHEPLPERVVRPSDPRVLPHAGALPGALHVARAGHPLVAVLTLSVRHDEVAGVVAVPLGDLRDEVLADRDDAAPLFLRALAQLTADDEARVLQVEVAPFQRHRLVHAQAREPQQDAEIVLPALHRADAGIHLGPGRRDRGLRGLPRHAKRARRRHVRAGLVVVVQPLPGELHDLDDLAPGGVAPIRAVHAAVLQIGVPVGEQPPREQRWRQRCARPERLVEVALEHVEGPRVADRRLRLQHACALGAVVRQQRPQVCLRVGVARLPAVATRDRVVDLALEIGRRATGGELAAVRRAVGVAPTDAPCVITSFNTRHLRSPRTARRAPTP